MFQVGQRNLRETVAGQFQVFILVSDGLSIRFFRLYINFLVCFLVRYHDLCNGHRRKFNLNLIAADVVLNINDANLVIFRCDGINNSTLVILCCTVQCDDSIFCLVSTLVREHGLYCRIIAAVNGSVGVSKGNVTGRRFYQCIAEGSTFPIVVGVEVDGRSCIWAFGQSAPVGCKVNIVVCKAAESVRFCNGSTGELTGFFFIAQVCEVIFGDGNFCARIILVNGFL